MEIRRYLSIVRRRLLLIVVILIAALGTGFVITPRDHNYTATSTLYVGSRAIDVNPTSGQQSGDRVAGLDRLIATFTALLPTRPIAQAAVTATKVARSPDQVAGSTSAKQVVNTDLISVSYTDRDPAVSQLLANAVAASLVAQIRAFEPRDSKAAAGQVVSVYQE
ncbi:MAG: Chromosome partitioning protein, partial [Actinomycetia bacterium]|nr:Chromosome partitioning protein [Actinomycetes bacterium]